MKRKVLILILIIVIAALGVVAYYGYTQYNLNQMKKYMIAASDANTTALAMNTTQNTYLNKSDYTNAIKVTQSMKDKFQEAIDNDKKAMKHASGPYKDYLTYDIIRLTNNIKLSNNHIDAFEKAKIGDYTGALAILDNKKYSDSALEYRNKEDEILAKNPDMFSFLADH